MLFCSQMIKLLLCQQAELKLHAKTFNLLNNRNYFSNLSDDLVEPVNRF